MVVTDSENIQARIEALVRDNGLSIAEAKLVVSIADGRLDSDVIVTDA